MAARVADAETAVPHDVILDAGLACRVAEAALVGLVRGVPPVVDTDEVIAPTIRTGLGVTTNVPTLGAARAVAVVGVLTEGAGPLPSTRPLGASGKEGAGQAIMVRAATSSAVIHAQVAESQRVRGLPGVGGLREGLLLLADRRLGLHEVGEIH